MDQYDRQVISRIMQQVWQIIGHDISQAREEAYGDSSVPRDEVAEVCLDSYESHVEQAINRSFNVGDRAKVKAVLERFAKLTFQEKTRLTLQAFPFGRYG